MRNVASFPCPLAFIPFFLFVRNSIRIAANAEIDGMSRHCIHPHACRDVPPMSLPLPQLKNVYSCALFKIQSIIRCARMSLINKKRQAVRADPARIEPATYRHFIRDAKNALVGCLGVIVHAVAPLPKQFLSPRAVLRPYSNVRRRHLNIEPARPYIESHRLSQRRKCLG